MLTKADNHFGADDARRGENIDYFQAARFGRAGSVQANSKEGAVAVEEQTFVEQEFYFLLGKYLGLSVSFDLHPWCILTRRDRVLHTYCITAPVGGGISLFDAAGGDRQVLAIAV